MAIKIDDKHNTGTPARSAQGVYVARFRVWWKPEAFVWWDGTNFSKGYLTPEQAAEGHTFGTPLQRHEVGSWWNGVTGWRYFEDPPRFPSLKPTAAGDRERVADILRGARGG